MIRKLCSLVPPLLIPLCVTGCDQPSNAADVTTGAPESSLPARADEPVQTPVPEPRAGEAAQAVTESDAIELEWDALIPEDWRPDKLMAEYNADDLSDDDPRAKELMKKLTALWSEAPVVPELDGKRIKLPGFVVPLEMNTETITEFLLVPYYGACIHVPPPPANQTVYVVTDPANAYQGQLFDTVWVTGTIKVEHLSNDLAEAGYKIQKAQVDPYE